MNVLLLERVMQNNNNNNPKVKMGPRCNMCAFVLMFAFAFSLGKYKTSKWSHLSAKLLFLFQLSYSNALAYLLPRSSLTQYIINTNTTR